MGGSCGSVRWVRDCDRCGVTKAACDVLWLQGGRGCCDACLLADTHGLVAPAGSIEALRVRLEQVEAELLAKRVLDNTEIARAMRKYERQIELLQSQVAELLETTRAAEPGERSMLMVSVMTEVRQVVRDLPERVTILEKALPYLEAKLGLRRKPEKFKVTKEQKALPPAPPASG